MKNQISSFAKALNIFDMGVCDVSDTQQAIVFLFPYYTPAPKGNISRYAYGEDYHKVVNSYLSKISEYIRSISGKDFSDNLYCDVSPYNDKQLAYMAGLGFFGKNTLLINPRIGSYFFIGYIITEGLSLPTDTPLRASCMGCGNCISHCPGGAISDTSFDKNLCASHISQKKGDLSEKEVNILLSGGYVWGCDICQSSCPHNKDIPSTPLSEFSAGLLTNISADDISGLSEKEFKTKYSGKAFTWRGKKPLLRNILLNGK